MEIGKNVRLKIGNSILRKKVGDTKRQVCYSNINQVRKIGIVWDASHVTDFTYLSKFCQKMNERNIDVKIIGYFSGKNLPDQYTAIRYLTCIRREELSFFYHPASSESDAFIRNRFDILIDINTENLLPLRCLSALSNAALKVGLFEPGRDGLFDLMIELNKPVDVNNYLAQAVHYLEMIHSEQVEKTY